MSPMLIKKGLKILLFNYYKHHHKTWKLYHIHINWKSVLSAEQEPIKESSHIQISIHHDENAAE